MRKRCSLPTSEMLVSCTVHLSEKVLTGVSNAAQLTWNIIDHYQSMYLK